MRYRAAVIGCGQVGGRLDSGADVNVLTHAHAYHMSGKFRITCCCDTDPGSVADFRAKWGDDIRGYDDPDKLFEYEDIDAVSICSDTESHCGLLLKALSKNGLKVIICEKPLVSSAAELRAVRKAISMHPEKKVMVNYQRRYDPGFEVIDKIVSEEKLGRPLFFQGIFTKGLYHNGCHALELLERLFGEMKSVGAGNCIPFRGDHYGTFFIRCRRCSGAITNFIKTDYAIFEIDIIFEKGRIRVAESGHNIEIYKSGRSKMYRGINELKMRDRLKDTLRFRTVHLIGRANDLLAGRHTHDNILEAHLALTERSLVLREALSAGKREIVFGRGI